MTGNQLIIGTRGSDLALKQTSMVKALLAAAHPNLGVEHKVIATAGDKRPDLRFEEFSKGENAMLDKGIFIKELEMALEDLSIDAAVHSLKDVPSDLEKQFAIAAVLERAPIQDVLISREKFTVETLPAGSRVGTSSVRRARQLKWLRPDIEVVELRGNVPTRIRKVVEPGKLDAIMLAAAGLVRLGLLNEALDTVSIDQVKLHAQVLDQTKFYPAAGQGAIAIETRSRDSAVIDLIRSLNHAETEARVVAEREFLRLLGAGCQTPVGAHSWVINGKLHMAVRVFSESDVSANPVEAEASMSISSPLSLAKKLASMVG
ncbi:MAG: Porphobilinogen deaminase [Verrucomicrobiaceae bacterium]|nr:Porphobilinogen deaminase [Verrucomicrobiaceae bacterium]MDB6119726.1 Porphobilinogen deaminase [Verrucomicrobiaceae bacterium]